MKNKKYKCLVSDYSGYYTAGGIYDCDDVRYGSSRNVEDLVREYPNDWELVNDMDDESKNNKAVNIVFLALVESNGGFGKYVENIKLIEFLNKARLVVEDLKEIL